MSNGTRWYRWSHVVTGLVLACWWGGWWDITVVSAANEKVYTVAVLPFETSGESLKHLSSEVSTLLNTYLSSQPGVTTVERAELDKALGEAELGISGNVSPETAAKIGKLTGAKILVTGNAFAASNELVLVAKIIGTETSRSYGETVSIPLRDSPVKATEELGKKIAQTITEKGETLVAKVEAPEDPLAHLRELVKGKKLPTVSVTISEIHLDRPTLDPAAETEFGSMLTQLGFTVLDAHTTTKLAEIDILGEAFSELGMRKGNLVSSKGRVEVKAIEHATGKILAVDRETQVAVDLSEHIAAKSAIQKAAAILVQRMTPQLLQLSPDTTVANPTPTTP